MATDFSPSCGAWDGGKGMTGEFKYNATNDVYYVGNGCAIYSLYDRYPALRPFYTDFEISFNALPFVDWTAANMHLSLVFSIGYIVLVFLGQRWMANAKPIKSNLALFLWNFLLAVFSIIGFFRTAPHLISFLYDYGFRASICAPAVASFGMVGNSWHCWGTAADAAYHPIACGSMNVPFSLFLAICFKFLH